MASQGEQQNNSNASASIAVPPPQPVIFNCYICHRPFSSRQALSAHMRSHPNRNWRGVYPPPTFSRAEFDNFGYQTERAPEVPQVVVPQGEVIENAIVPVVEQESFRRPILPDLNELPPPESE